MKFGVLLNNTYNIGDDLQSIASTSMIWLSIDKNQEREFVLTGNSSLKKKTLSGLVWTFMERVGAQGVSFIVSLVLARLLLPEQYGIVALVTVIINIFKVKVYRNYQWNIIIRMCLINNINYWITNINEMTKI